MDDITKGLYHKTKHRERRSKDRLVIDQLDAKKLIFDYCKQGDTESFNLFFQQQSHRLWRYIVAKSKDEELAYDIVSESFLKFSQNVCKDPRAPVALLYRIALNLYIDVYRRQKNSPVESNNHEAVERSPDLSVLGFDEFAYLRKAVGELEEKDQNMIMMRFWMGMTHQEVAEILDLPAGTVRRRSAELLKILSANLANQDNSNVPG